MTTADSPFESGRDNSSSGRAFNSVNAKIQALPFREFQQCVFLWLGAVGFRNIRFLGRHHRRGRRNSAGADFLAVLPRSGLPIAIQVRHWRTPVQRWAIDSLRGFMLRYGVSAGLIVSNQSFARAAALAATQYSGRPIQLVSGADLSRSLIALDLGVIETADSVVVDPVFFRSFSQLRFANSPVHAMSSPIHRQSSTWAPIANQPLTETGQAGAPKFDPQLLALTLTLSIIVVLWLVFGGRR